MTAIRCLSYGGGVQSTALLVLAAQRRIDFPLAIMANVGDDSEHPATLEYVRNVAVPYAEANGIELVILDRVMRDGTTRTLLQQLHIGKKSVPLPVRMPGGAPGTRSCTVDFKIAVLRRELKRRGAHGPKPCRAHRQVGSELSLEDQLVAGCEKCKPANKAVVGIGISLDEIGRANRHTDNEDYREVVYPLLGIGEETGLKLSRLDCERVIREAGLPVPPKSSCWFCPFHSLATWADQARNEPELFQQACDLEAMLIQRRADLGKDPVYFTNALVPLPEAVDQDQLLLPIVDGGSCDSGWCFT